MKHIMKFLLALLPFLAQAQIVVNPDYEYRVSSIMSIRSIERTADCTRVNLRATFRPNWWFSFDKSDKITNTDNPQQTFLPTAIEGLEFGEHRFMGQEGVHDFTVIYPPLPADIKRIDMMDEGTIGYKGISLTETRHDPFAGQREAWMDAHPESPMKEMVRMGERLTEKQFYNIGTATIRGQIGHYDSRLDVTCDINSGDPIFEQHSKLSYETHVNPDGTFTATFPVSGPTVVDVAFLHRSFGYYNNNPLYIEPGQTIDLFVDWEDDILAFYRGRGLLPYLPMVLRGPLAEVNRQIREAPLVPSEWQPRADRDMKGNLESLQRHYNADMPALRHYLKRSDLLPKAKQYLENNARLMYAGWRLRMPVFMMSRLLNDGSGRVNIDAYFVKNFVAQMDSSYYFDILRDIDLNDITQFATFGGKSFLNNYADIYAMAFSMIPFSKLPPSLGDDYFELYHKRAEVLGYKSLPIVDQLNFLSSRGHVWCKLNDVVNGKLDVEELSEYELSNDYLTCADADRNVTHPKLKAINKRLTKECYDMMAKIKSKPLERLQWMDEHPIVEQADMNKPYDSATFFTTDSVTIRVKIGRYDKSNPLVACGLLSACGGVEKTEDITVADDGTFTIRAEVTHPGIVMVPIGKVGDKFYQYSQPTRLELYVEPGHTLDVYIDRMKIDEREGIYYTSTPLEYIVRGDLSAINSTLRSRPHFEFRTDYEKQSVSEMLASFDMQWAVHEKRVEGYCERQVFYERPRQFIRSELAVCKAEWLCDMLLQRHALQQKGDVAMEQTRLVNSILQMVDLDYFSFLRELPKDDFVMAGTPSGFELMRMIVCGNNSWCSNVLDALIAGEKQVTDEDVYDNKNMDSRMQIRLGYYGTDTLPLFEQAAFVWFVRCCVENFAGQEIPESSTWLENVRAAGDKYITHPGMRRLMKQTLERM